MHDDFLTADWARNHSHTTEAIQAVLTTLGDSLARLNRYEFDAPWRHDATRVETSHF